MAFFKIRISGLVNFVWSLFKSCPFAAYLSCISYPSIFAIGIIERLTSSNNDFSESSFNILYMKNIRPSVLAGSFPCRPPM